jgi:glutamate racemase
VIDDREVAVIDPAPAVARRVEQLLDQFEMRADAENEAQYAFVTFASDDYLNRLKDKALQIISR